MLHRYFDELIFIRKQKQMNQVKQEVKFTAANNSLCFFARLSFFYAIFFSFRAVFKFRAVPELSFADPNNFSVTTIKFNAHSA